MENYANLTRIQSDDLEYVVSKVNQHLNSYDVQVTPVSVRFFYVSSDNPDIAGAFDEIRKDLVFRGYVPFLYQNGEHYLEVTHRPAVKYRGAYLNLIMLFLTLASTVYVGSMYAINFVPDPADIMKRVLYGLIYFAIPLMLILGVHETGHYVVAKKHKVRASLPFFITYPLAIGTFGAFISLRDPMPNRKVMTEIGIAGPIAGFLTALPILFVSSYLSSIFPALHSYRIEIEIRIPQK